MTSWVQRWGGDGRRARAAVAVLAVLAACRDGRPYAVGVVLGGEGELGARMAVEQINAAGGVGGRPLEMRTFKGAYNSGAQIALQVAESLSADPTVVAVIGHANSSASLAASQVYNERHLVQIAPTTTAPLYSQAGPFSFRLVASDEHQARFLTDTLLARKNARIAVLYVNDDYGRALHSMVNAALAEGGAHSVYEGSYVEDDTANGAADLIPALARSQPTILLWLGRGHEFELIANRLRAALPHIEVLASDGLGGVTVENDSAGVFNGVRYVRLVDIARPDTALQRVRAEYNEFGRGDLSDQAALAFDAVGLVAQAIREVGADRERIREWLSGLGHEHPPLSGITGPLAFPIGGDRAPTYVLVTVGAPRSESRAR